MWRLGAELAPGYFPKDEWSTVPCYQKAIFGISRPHPNFKTYESVMTYNNGFLHSVLPGADNRLYWFFFLNLDEPAYGDDAPKFTKDDEARVVKEHIEDPVMPGLRLGDLYSTAEVTVMTCLQEHVFKRWHFQRIITLGDAAHKFNPETGQGANSAIETAAAIANEISRLLARTDKPTDDDISASFARVQEQRFDHVKALVKRATEAARAETFTTAMGEFTVRHIMPNLDAQTSLNGFMSDFVDGVTLENLPIPFRPRLVPFSNELPSKPLKTTVSRTVAVLTATFLLAMPVYLAQARDWRIWSGLTHIPSSPWISTEVISDQAQTLVYHVLVYVPIFFMWTLDGQRAGNGSSVSQW
ncbi:FAD binding domain protein [Colletotrichum truncatum]|uniref:FAD binding domain protein n=1 Tax=Colletotrichum truncatum TaxID=5467 RepID=A0ACC3YXS3_COLTU